MEKVVSRGETAKNTWVVSWTTNDRDMGLLNGKMGDSTKVIGEMENSTVKEFTLRQMDPKRLVCGRMARTLNG